MSATEKKYEAAGVSQFIRAAAECISAHCHSARPLSRGTTGHKGLFLEADPSSPILPVFLFFAAVSGRAYCLPAEAKTSFESPVSALHAKPFVAARILLNMRQASKQASKEKIEEEENSHRLLFDKSDIRLSVTADN